MEIVIIFKVVRLISDSNRSSRNSFLNFVLELNRCGTITLFRYSVICKPCPPVYLKIQYTFPAVPLRHYTRPEYPTNNTQYVHLGWIRTKNKYTESKKPLYNAGFSYMSSLHKIYYRNLSVRWKIFGE